jgi:hypothetical protein
MSEAFPLPWYLPGTTCPHDWVSHAKSTDEGTYEVSEPDPVPEEIFARGTCSVDDVKAGETHVLLGGHPYDATSDGAVAPSSALVYGYQNCAAAPRAPNICPKSAQSRRSS